MTWKISSQIKSLDGVPIGTPYGGGYVAGFISHTANGVPTHALIVAPASTGATGGGYILTTNLEWKTATTATGGTTSTFDGSANTAAMVTAGIANHPAAQFCVNLSIGGFTDWYLPSRLELDIAYFNLKPGTQANTTFWGANSYSVPVRAANYIESYPARTGLPLFTSSETFADATHWSSTENSSANGWGVGFINGVQAGLSKTSAQRVRAFRRVAL